MKTLFLLICVGTSLIAEVILPEKGIHEISASRVLKTADRKIAADTIISTVEQAGGWLLIDHDQWISLRIPAGSLDTLLEIIDSLGIVTDRRFTRTDRTDECLRLVAGLEAKEALLKQYLTLLDSSDAKGIYPVSREIADLQDSIEQLKGQLNGIFERMEYAEITIHFTFYDRRPPLTSGHSDFEWLNTVDLPSLLEEFR